MDDDELLRRHEAGASYRELAAELTAAGSPISHTKVGRACLRAKTRRDGAERRAADAKRKRDRERKRVVRAGAKVELTGELLAVAEAYGQDVAEAMAKRPRRARAGLDDPEQTVVSACATEILRADAAGRPVDHRLAEDVRDWVEARRLESRGRMDDSNQFRKLDGVENDRAVLERFVSGKVEPVRHFSDPVAGHVPFAGYSNVQLLAGAFGGLPTSA